MGSTRLGYQCQYLILHRKAWANRSLQCATFVVENAAMREDEVILKQAESAYDSLVAQGRSDSANQQNWKSSWHDNWGQNSWGMKRTGGAYNGGSYPKARRL